MTTTEPHHPIVELTLGDGRRMEVGGKISQSSGTGKLKLAGGVSGTMKESVSRAFSSFVHARSMASSSLADDHRNDRLDERVALVLAGDGPLLP